LIIKKLYEPNNIENGKYLAKEGREMSTQPGIEKQRVKVKHKVARRNNIEGWILMLPMVIVLYLMIWRPTVMGAIWSTFRMKGYTPHEFIGLRNYIEVVKDTQFLPTLWNTVMYVFWSLVVGYLPPVILAIMINEMVHFKNGFKIVLYLPQIVPGVAALLMWYYIYYPDSSGLLNFFLAKFGIDPYIWLNDGRFTILYIVISMTWSGFAGTMVLYYAAVQSISSELYEAAIIDGAGMLKRVRYVTIPQLSGVLLLTFVKQIISVFQVVEQPLVMTGGGPNGASTSLGYQLYKYGFVNGRAGHAMALGVIIFFILITLTVLYMRLNKKVEENY